MYCSALLKTTLKKFYFPLEEALTRFENQPKRIIFIAKYIFFFFLKKYFISIMVDNRFPRKVVKMRLLELFSTFVAFGEA